MIKTIEDIDLNDLFVYHGYESAQLILDFLMFLQLAKRANYLFVTWEHTESTINSLPFGECP